MPRKIWVYDPQVGGRKIPDVIKPRIRQRILAHAQKHYAGKYNRIADFSKWKKVFASHTAAHRDADLILKSLWLSLEDPPRVFPVQGH